jgi:hypothetical protein
LANEITIFPWKTQKVSGSSPSDFEATHQDDRDVREAVVSLADVRQPAVVEQDLLKDEGGDGFRQFRAALHDPQAQRDDFGGEQERDDFLLVGLHQSPDDSETRQTQILKRTRL